MVWSCTACTFENASDASLTCEICTTLRPGKDKSVVDLSNERNSVIHPSSSFRADSYNAAPTADAAAARRSAPGRSSVDRKMTQMNLFGKYVAKSDENSQKPKSRKRKGPPPASSDTKPAFPSSKSRAVQRNVQWDEPFPSLWEKANKNMKDFFRISSLRNLQPAAVESALRRQNSIIVMATGQGKSLCYQLPATVLGGVTLVISPLIALMFDQVQALTDKGIAAALISSASGAAHNRTVMERLVGRRSSSQIKKGANAPLEPVTILYGTPELVQTERFRNVLTELYKKNLLAMFAVDEAHCVSTWGHDFRPAYRKLQWLRTTFPNIPCMACTATATDKVIADIRETLLLPKGEAPCLMGSFNRPNISYEVRFKDSLDAMSPSGAMGDLVAFVQQQHTDAGRRSVPCSGIIYVHRRQDTESLAKQITKETGLRAAPYHAGLKDAERKEIQGAWTKGSIQIAVATVAFGMGIDLAHVRYVIHWTLAKTVEGFYQESGRAGRDGLPAVSILYFSKDEASKFSYLIQQQSNAAKDPQKAKRTADRSLAALQLMVNYCLTPCCRRKSLLEHFGEHSKGDICMQTCDYCVNPQKIEKAIEISQFVKDVIGANQGSSHKSLPSPAKWDGQWSKPHGEEDSEGENDWNEPWTEGDLGITTAPASLEDSGKGCSDSSGVAKRPAAQSFVKASSILEKYEAMENRESQPLGFVRFKTEAGSSVGSGKPVVIPEHMRGNLPDPLGHLSKRTEAASAAKSSSELSREVDRHKDELASLKKQQEERSLRLREMMSSARRTTANLPPPPSLSFENGRMRR